MNLYGEKLQNRRGIQVRISRLFWERTARSNRDLASPDSRRSVSHIAGFKHMVSCSCSCSTAEILSPSKTESANLGLISSVRGDWHKARKSLLFPVKVLDAQRDQEIREDSD